MPNPPSAISAVAAVPAVVARSIGECSVEEVSVRSLRPNDVLVRIDASGICHSDVAVLRGELARPLPVVLGHEGAGTVLDVGSAVTAVQPGDVVVLAAIGSCGRCYCCARGLPYLCEEAPAMRSKAFGDGTMHFDGTSGLGTLAGAVVIDQRMAVKVETTLPAEQLCTIGCAVLTGTGSALNLAEVRAGDSVLIIGAGGVGLAAVQGARAQGASTIAVIDPSPAARSLARQCGATHAVEPGDDTELRDVAGARGFDSVLDFVSTTATTRTAWDVSRRGATIVVVGVQAPTHQFPVPIVDIALTGKRVVGCVYGGSSIHRDIARYVAMAERGALDLDVLIGRRISLADAPAALLGPASGPGRTVVVFD